MISVQNVSHGYQSLPANGRELALDHLSFTVESATFCTILGPNGSGKSTLFQLLSGMQKPSAGRATIHGEDCTSLKARKNLGIVFQTPALDKILTVRENLKFFGQLHGLSGKRLQSRIEAVMQWTHVADRMDSPVETLSGGQQRQAELAKCLIPSPSVLLLDEPTTGLDPSGRQAFQDTILRLRDQEGLTILMTTHVFNEANAADKVVFLEEGQKIAEGPPRRLCQSLGTEMIIIQPKTETAENCMQLAQALQQAGYPSAHATGQDIRLKDLKKGEGPDLIAGILHHFRDSISSIAVKQPTLDDVFLTLTSHQQQHEAIV